jgi:Phage tail assembly chaperone protein
MKNLMVNGAFSHDLMMEVLADMYPQLKPGKDYLAGHMIDPTDESGHGAPFLMYWRSTDVEKPDEDAVAAEFRANEATYRARFARRLRDASLLWSDAKVAAPVDAPATFSRSADVWKAYRQALRDVPQQAGFPMDIDWPALPQEGDSAMRDQSIDDKQQGNRDDAVASDPVT